MTNHVTQCSDIVATRSPNKKNDKELLVSYNNTVKAKS